MELKNFLILLMKTVKYNYSASSANRPTHQMKKKKPPQHSLRWFCFYGRGEKTRTSDPMSPRHVR